jgi:hypothetical protein
MIIGGPKMRGRNVGDLGGGEGAGEGERKEGGWVAEWVLLAAAATQQLQLRCRCWGCFPPLSLSLSLSLSPDTVFLFWLLWLSRRFSNEMSSNQLHFWDFSFVFLRLQLHFSCAMYMPCCSLWFFVAHDEGVASFFHSLSASSSSSLLGLLGQVLGPRDRRVRARGFEGGPFVGTQELGGK